jgi:hypothetical protein
VIRATLVSASPVVVVERLPPFAQSQKIAALYQTNGLSMKFPIRRTVYLIGPDGVIRYARRGKPSPEEVLASSA